MKHLSPLSIPRRAAEIEDVVQVVGLISAILSLLRDYADTFGITIPQKGAVEE